ncbi:hypothetical protein PPYR_08755 [Photinus pyralis]|uniref:Protein lethal(3)malignant blood neoplasm 1 n=2 Tax=Photinus pyralis TaxID=7054 RepID=A0A5N4AK80_PHOPY|nr:uncharacterized protein LOC116172148 [Photinus pyralis]KAB0797762.1 hypothetical protein PPYR_08755 [Photinus pyralis]
MVPTRWFYVLLTLGVCGEKIKDENRPYEFSFTIDSQQHRYEKKDINGIVQGEFGFITADGVYHVTVYATDENGNFKIISMKNIKISERLDRLKESELPKIPGFQYHTPTTPQQSYPTITTVATTVRPVLSTKRLPKFLTASTIRVGCGGCGIITTPRSLKEFFNGRTGKIESTTVETTKVTNSAYLKPNAPRPEDAPSFFEGSPKPRRVITESIVISQTEASTIFNRSPKLIQQNAVTEEFRPTLRTHSEETVTMGTSNVPVIFSSPSDNIVTKAPPGQNPQLSVQETTPHNEIARVTGAVTNSTPKPGTLVIFSSERSTAPPTHNPQLSVQATTAHNLIASAKAVVAHSTPKPETLVDVIRPQLLEEPNKDVIEIPKGVKHAHQKTARYVPDVSAKAKIENGAIRVPGHDPILIQDKYPNMVDGLPHGVTKADISDLLYKFNYTVGFHGHYEKGWRNGTKVGGYFVNGRDGYSRIVTYVADEFGYRPKFKMVRLGLDSLGTPKEDTEKSFGLESFEFVWYPLS